MNLKVTPMFCFLLALSIITVSAAAQTQTQQTYWHNSDYYSIQLNGAGNAFISEATTLQSLSKLPTSNITLEIPYPNITVYQIVSINGSYSYYSCIDCGYYNINPEFVNYTTTKVGNSTMLSIRLNRPLLNSSQTTLYIFFSARGIAKKVPVGYSFSFKTVIDRNALIRDTYANVAVPENMNLKGKPALNINYSGVASAQTNLIGAGSASAVAKALPSLFYYGQYQYHASNLLPGEYFAITGLYSSSLILLYIPEIIVIILVIIGIVMLFKFVLISRIKGLFFVRGKTKTEKLKAERGRFSFIRAALVGAVSGFLFQIAYFSMQALSNLVHFNYYYNSPLPILLGILVMVVCVLALFGLPYYFCYRFNKKEAVLAGIISIIAAIVYLAIILYLFATPPIIAYPLAV